MKKFRWAMVWAVLSAGAAMVTGTLAAEQVGADTSARSAENAWPAITRQARPWAYNWWMASAVDAPNLSRELKRYHDAGLGGIHIIPIYGAKGFEDKFIDYLSPKWMEMLNHAVTEANNLNMGVDMSIGTGWCFGGPNITPQTACWQADGKVLDAPVGAKLRVKLDKVAPLVALAYGPDGKNVDVTDKLGKDGTLNWAAPGAGWKVCIVTVRQGTVKVKRPAPGGEGYMLNPFYGEAIRTYLKRFDEAFDAYKGLRPRAMYHDSYEYSTNWSPDLFAEFQKRRGYALQTQLPALFSTEKSDQVLRVKCDYRETVSDMMVENFNATWTDWSRARGFISRDQAHGSPANLLDLYAGADVPETELFLDEQHPLVNKFASSAAHVAGRQLTSSEGFTWMREHFTETLADFKQQADLLMAAGINHIFYHGTCYSPDEASWPGWHFYASSEMNPRNAIWRDAWALNDYIARCQSVLQAGRPDNEILLYWPIHDFWQGDAKGLTKQMTVHGRDWLEAQSIGRVGKTLWDRGYGFDYISDRQILRSQMGEGGIRTARDANAVAGVYKIVVVPSCNVMPVETLEKLLSLATDGATVIFEGGLPKDVPGLGNLEQRREKFKALLAPLGTDSATQPAGGNLVITKAVYGAGDKWIDVTDAIAKAVKDNSLSVVPRNLLGDPMVGTLKTLKVEYEINGRKSTQEATDRATLKIEGNQQILPAREVKLGKGCVRIGGDLEEQLAKVVACREAIADHPGAVFIRRSYENGWYYFISNKGDKAIDGWVAIGRPAADVLLMDPMTGRTGVAVTRRDKAAGKVSVYCQLSPGESVILKADNAPSGLPRWPYAKPAGNPVELATTWQVKFIDGGPELPAPFQTGKLASWTTLGGEAAQKFAGAALYSATFDAPAGAEKFLLSLGKVCQSARVRVNGKELGTVFMPPFNVTLDGLKPKGNLLEVEVTNVSANRIRDLDRRGVKWKSYYDINFVNKAYKPFDASDWPLTDSGLLGPVTLTPMKDFDLLESQQK